MDALSLGGDISPVSSMFADTNTANLGRFSSMGAAGKSPDAAADEFESLFMSQMLQPMFSTLEVDDTFGGGKGEEIMRSMMVQEYGKAIVQHFHTPLHEAIRTEIVRKQSRYQTKTAPDSDQHLLDRTS